jgi:hypothetical protein
MGKIPNYLNPSDNPEALTDQVLFEWSALGMHMTNVHVWSYGGPEHPDGLTERVDYLLEVLSCLDIMEPLTEMPLHPSVIEWRSFALMTLNSIKGRGIPRDIQSLLDASKSFAIALRV